MTVINRRKLSGTGVSNAHAKEFLDSAEAGLSDLIQVAMDDAPDVSGGGTTQSVGFQLKDINGNNVALATLADFAVFDEADLVTPATNATLDTASAGTIVGGAGTAALKVKTDANGKFTCTLTDLVDETVHMSTAPTFGSPILDCNEIDSVQFSA